MRLAKRMKKSAVSILLVMVLGVFAASEAAADTCSEGLGVPPFLGVETIPPNLLIMMDNSGSMYDLNYVEDVGYCFDDNYNNSLIYAGYFLDIDEYDAAAPIWYTYNTASGEFVRTTEAAVITDCNTAGGTRYLGEDAASAYYLCANINEPSADPMTHSMAYFAATGKFLNWMVSSKMDIQKQILSGGKWNGTQLVAESRGCLGRRFVKQVTVNGGAANLTFAISADKDDVDGDLNPNNTIIGMYAASSSGGFNNEACLETMQALQSPTGVGGITTPLDECLGDPPNKSQQGDMNSSFNLSIQDCWYMAKFGVEEWRKVFSPSAIRNQCEKLYEGGLGGYYPATLPWDLPDNITALVCKGDFDTSDGFGSGVPDFVGRCYVPAGYSYVAAFTGEEATEIAAAGRGTKASQEENDAFTWGMTMAAADNTAQESRTDNGGQEQPEAAKGISLERTSLIEALKEFINTGGRSTLARARVMQAVYDFFVSEVEAAAGVVEETAATCVGDWRGAAGFSLGSLYSKDVGDICTFPTDGWIFTHGLYTVEVASPCGLQLNSSVDWTINHANGSTPYTQDQETDCGKWLTITGPETGGTFEFLDDGSGTVVITSNSTSKRTYADVVRFTLVEEIEPPPAPVGSHPYVVSILRVTPSPTELDSVSFNVTFSEEVINFNDASDLIITETGTLTHTGVTITGGPKAYAVTVTGLSGEGEISIDVNTWIRNWQENSAAGIYDEAGFFFAPVPAVLATGSYVYTIGPTTDKVIVERLTTGFSTPEQRRSALVDYPRDEASCCDPVGTDTCCQAAGYPLDIYLNWTHWLAPDGWNDIAAGRDDFWQAGDTITFDIVTGSDVRSTIGGLVTFGKRSAAIERIEAALVVDCDEESVDGAAWLCDKCIENAIVDFCGFMSVPEVPDPSDQSGLAGEGQYWNIPALMWDAALDLQLQNTIAYMSAKREKAVKPEGIIHEYADLIRFGLMKYRSTGDKSECGDYDLFKNCATDGAYVDVPIGENTLAHANLVAEALNSEPATTWTPLAEAMYTGTGYYTQKGSMRLNSTADYPVNADAAADPAYLGHSWSAGGIFAAGEIVELDGVYYRTAGGGTSTSGITSILEDENITDWEVVNDPIIASCQRNFVLFITEGSSTADLSPTVANFAALNGDGDAETSTTGCDVLKGSTYFDDMVHYAYAGSDIYEYEEFAAPKNNIEAHIVNTQSPRTAGLVGECSPYDNLAAAAANTADAAVADPITGYVTYDDPLYYGGNPQELYTAIWQVFNNIITQTSSGSAASVISASKEGEGALYQALFWPATEANLAPPNPQFVQWTGEVHAFLVDSFGNLREDDNGNGAIDASDPIVVIYYDNSLEKTRACNGTVANGVCTGTGKELADVNYLWSSTDYLNRDTVDANILGNRPLLGDGSFNFSGANKDRRYIFTWNDLDNNGAVDYVTEILPFVENFGGVSGFPAEGDGFGDPLGRAPVEHDFQNSATIVDDPGTPEHEPTEWANSVIKWLRGQDQPGLRSRQVRGDNNNDTIVGAAEAVTWKLGDIIHSTPVLAARPAENYHQLYRDYSYAEFAERWKDRRNMVYYGSNGGMLHATNGGFYKKYPSSRFCLTPECVLDGSGDELNTADVPLLGTEMWAYVPYNLLPHLACLTDPLYAHKYYVDLRPRIFDVQIFAEESACLDPSKGKYHEECIHPNGWGTILVGGMRFGGSPTRLDYLVDTDSDGTPDTKDNREFTSAYFILDITNPETPPTLMGEFTRTFDPATGLSSQVDLNYTTSISTMIPMKIGDENGVDKNCDGDTTDTGISEWFLVLGSGPDELDGTSSQPGKLSIVPLERLVDTDAGGPDVVQDMRIPAAPPTSPDEFGTFTLPDAQSFPGDLITVDMETTRDYLADVVYFGTVSGDWVDGSGTEGWGGKLYRLVTRDWESCSGRVNQIYAPPSSWSALYEPATTPFIPLIDVQQPIISAPTVGTDGIDFYVYFGTGRFFHNDDKEDSSSNSTQTFYGLREPMSSDIADLSFLGVQPASPPCQLTWSQIWNDRLSPETGGLKPDGVTPLTSDHRAYLGLVPVHDIEILSTSSINENGTLACADGTTDCLDPSLVWTTDEADDYGDPSLAGETKSMKALQDYITGDYIRCSGNDIGKDGWYRDLQDKRERNLGQASLLAGLVSFNSYQPFIDVCLAEGLGYLYGIYYLTGTPWIEDIFGFIDAGSSPRVANPARVFLGKGLSTTPNIHVGEEEGGKAFVQTSVGQIIEIPQPNLPNKEIKSGRIKWRDVEE